MFWCACQYVWSTPTRLGLHTSTTPVSQLGCSLSAFFSVPTTLYFVRPSADVEAASSSSGSRVVSPTKASDKNCPSGCIHNTQYAPNKHHAPLLSQTEQSRWHFDSKSFSLPFRWICQSTRRRGWWIPSPFPDSDTKDGSSLASAHMMVWKGSGVTVKQVDVRAILRDIGESCSQISGKFFSLSVVCHTMVSTGDRIELKSRWPQRCTAGKQRHGDAIQNA